MMNRIIFFLVLSGISLASCHEVKVGYLKSEHAAYPIDSLQIFDTTEIRNEISRLERSTATLADSLQAAMDSLRTAAEELKMEYSIRFLKEIRPIALELNELLKDSINHVGEIISLKEQLALKESEIEPMNDKAIEMEDEAFAIRDRLAQLDPSEGTPNVSALESLRKMKLRAERRISWTTSEIEGVDGTAPIYYSVTAVRAEKGGDADIFRSDLVVKGNGRMEVPYDFKAPAGYYHVSIRIENEGYSRDFEEVFTFIVNPVVAE